MIDIVDGVPGDFCRLFWMQDYARFGVTMEYIYAPESRCFGVHFKKGDLKKSIIISHDHSDDELAAKKFLEIEAEFGIPVEESLYKNGI